MTQTLSFLVLWLAGLSVCAQTLADIDTRTKPATGPSGHLVGSSGHLEEDSATLKAVFVVDDPNTLTAGKRFDYELVITNPSNVSVAIPRTLNWEDVEAGDGDLYSWASVDIRVDTGNGLEASLPFALTLYGTREKAWSESILAPGASIRILGSDVLPVSMNINAKPVGKATLKGMFHLGTLLVHHAPSREIPDGYSTERRWAFTAVAGERYPIDLDMKP